MTDPLSVETHTAPYTADPDLKTTSAQAVVNVSVDEPEDYTIKCICGYEEDDGNTVYCDTCDTWQHTECYYINKHGIVPSNKDLEDHDHRCADCQPRVLDIRGAVERQRNRRNGPNLDDRKIKKPASKSHKKKIRAPESNGVLTNGWTHGVDLDQSDRTSRSPRDPHPPPKRAKASHRFSHSMSFPLLSHNPTSNPHKRSGSAVQSPSKAHRKSSPNAPPKDPYSSEFIHLYDNDPGDASMHTNLLNDIEITDDLMNWSSDIDELEKATNGLTPQDVFVRYGQPVASMTLPQLNIRSKRDESSIIHGQHPSWKYLTIDTFTPKDSIVAELKGKIGHMQRYIHDHANRWDYLRHPAPFVFFHPKLPIYIDTRSEGTTCRYLRRSCDPNLSMKTSLENKSEYHFCFVAKQDLDAGSELTIGWVLDEHIRNYFSSRNQDNVKFEGELDEDYVADWVGKVLAEFGGCACNSSATCALAKYDRRPNGSTKGRNAYSVKHSSAETGDSMTSRAGSEQEDGRSSSGSKSRSRDMTPTNNSAADSMLGAGMEISDREKRKIAALEKNFEQLENDKHQPPYKKKKRNSGGSTVNTPSVNTSKQLGYHGLSASQPNTPGLPYKSQYTDASTSRRKSGSPTMKPTNPVLKPRTSTAFDPKKRSSQPNTPLIASPLVRQNYVSTSMQTDPEEGDTWYHPSPVPATAKKKYMSLTKRLLLRSQQDRATIEERRRASLDTADVPMSNGQDVSESIDNDAPHDDVDTEMQDSEQTQSSSMNNFEGHAMHDVQLPDRSPAMGNKSINSEIKPPPLWPGSETHRAVNEYRHNDLRVQLPSQPSIPSDSSMNTPLVETPTSTVSQSPSLQNSVPLYPPPITHSASNLVQPSPIKKKVSLGEYFSRRKGSQPASEVAMSSSPTLHTGAFKAPPGMNGDPRETTMRGSAMTDTPKKEGKDPLIAADGKDLEA